MKEISFEVPEPSAKEPTKYTIRTEPSGAILIIQKGPDSAKMSITVYCAKKLMEALEYVVRG